jgi:hypothetical protein
VTLLEEERIPECARRCYLVRAQAFVEAMRPKRLGELTAEEIKAFFQRYAREQRLSGLLRWSRATAHAAPAGGRLPLCPCASPGDADAASSRDGAEPAGKPAVPVSRASATRLTSPTRGSKLDSFVRI